MLEGIYHRYHVAFFACGRLKTAFVCEPFECIFSRIASRRVGC